MPITKMSDLGDKYHNIINAIQHLKLVSSNDDATSTGVLSPDFLKEFFENEYSDFTLEAFVKVIIQKVLQEIKDNLITNFDIDDLELLRQAIEALFPVDGSEALRDSLFDVYYHAATIEEANARRVTLANNGFLDAQALDTIERLLAEADAAIAAAPAAAPAPAPIAPAREAVEADVNTVEGLLAEADAVIAATPMAAPAPAAIAAAPAAVAQADIPDAVNQPASDTDSIGSEEVGTYDNLLRYFETPTNVTGCLKYFNVEVVSYLID